MDEYEHLTREELISLIRDLKKNHKRTRGTRSRVRAKFPVFGEWEQRDFESSPHPIRIFDRETLKYLAVNDATLKLYGYTRAEFLALTPTDTRHPEERAAFSSTLREPTGYLRHRGARRHVTKSGDIIVVEVVAQDIVFHGREARLNLTIDVTERVRMQEIMRRREQEFTALVENAPDIITRFDRGLRYVYVNPETSAATAIARERLIGRTCHEVGMPDDLATLWEEEIRRVFDTGKEGRIEFACPCHGGIRYYEARVVPEFGLDGAIETVLAVSRDVTERTQSELETKRQKKLLDAIIDNLPIGVFIRDAKTLRYVLRNRFTAETTGYPVDDPAGKSVYDLFPKEQADLFCQTDREVLAKGQIVEFPEEEVMGSSGGVRIHQVRKVPLFDEKGEPWLIVGLSDDVTERKRAERALRASEEFLRRMVGSSRDCIKVLDLNGHLLSMNAGGQRLMEIDDVTPLLNRPWLDFWRGADNEAARNAVATASKGETGQFEGYCATAKGAPKWWDVLVTPICGADGKPEKLLAVSRDITRRKHAEAETRRQEKLFEAVFDNLPLGVFVKDAQTLRYVRSNRYARRTFGYPVESSAGKTVYDLFPKEQAGRFDRTDREALETGRMVEVPAQEALGRAGDVRIQHVRKVPVFDEEGRPWVLVGIADDITERTRAGETQALLAAIAGSSNDAIITRSPDRTILSWNAAAERIFGWSAAEAIGQPIDLIVPPERRGALQATVERVLKGEPVEPVETTSLRKDGVRIDTQITLSALRDQSGKVIAFASTTRDITQRKRAEELLKRRKEEFESLAENMPDIVVRFDRGIRHIYVNAALERATGLPREAFLGKTHREVPLPAELAARFDESVREVFETGMSNQVEFSFITWDGECFFEARHIPERDARGQVVSALCVARDVTQRKRAEDELRRQKKLLDAIIEHLPVGVTVKDAGTLTYVMRNRVAAELTGLSIAEVIGKRAEEVYPPELAKVITAADRKALADGAGRAFPSLAVQRRTGRIARNLKVPVPDETGRYTHLVSIVEDLTDIEQAQAGLAEQKRLLSAIFEHLPVGITVKEACTRRYILRNRVAAELTGLNSADAIGKRADEVYPRDLAELIDASDRKALATGVPAIVSPSVARRRTGRVVRNLKVPVPDEAGRYTHLVSILEDLTDIDQAQGALRRSEERLWQLVSLSPASIFTLSIDPPFATTFISDNVTAQVGWRPSDFTEDPSFWFDHVHPDDRAAAGAKVARMTTEGRYTCEYRFRHKDGRWRWMHDEGQAVRDAVGTPREGIGIWMDITAQRQETEERVQQALRQRNALVREVHHRIKNHLQGIAGLLRQKALMHPAVASLIEAAVAQMRSVALVYGLQEGAESPVRLSQLLDSICTSVEDLSTVRINRRLDKSDAVAPQLAASEAVPVAVAINELIYNAAKHCDGGETLPAIDVIFLEHGAKVEIRIANRGSLPRGFDYATGAGCGTGLDLVKTLLGPRGSELSFRAREGWVETVLELAEPLVTVRAPEVVA